MIASFLGIYTASYFLKPFINYIRGAHGLRKYPGVNFLSEMSVMGDNWEVSRKHKFFHTKGLHEKLSCYEISCGLPKDIQIGVINMSPRQVAAIS